ncbi:hypothetical protein ILUMI_26378 [Ignelater luminosus]|uniref:Uncharacterized protein n=1 Tax=Ignelater luminosus TaxID=2038154 RepID=A0A8K0C4E0_IGNLU|nr:hypothetical protein ILUMI_26378 [Ignelater luminosus]
MRKQRSGEAKQKKGMKKHLKNRSNKNRTEQLTTIQEEKVKSKWRKLNEDYGKNLEHSWRSALGKPKTFLQILTESKDIMMRWKEHFRDFLKAQDAEDGSAGREAEAYSAVDMVSASRKSRQGMTMEGLSRDHDGVTPEMEYMGQGSQEALLAIF